MRQQLSAAILAILVGTAAAGQERAMLSPAVREFVEVDAPVVALTNVRVVDGTGAPARDGQTVVVSGSRIVAVGAGETTAVPAGARVLNLAGHTVMPGLVSLHEHTYFSGARTVPMDAGAPLYLGMGVTTAMTAGSQLPLQELRLKRTIDAGMVAGPRLLIAGPYISGAAARPSTFRYAATPEEAKGIVAEWAAKGATWFKVHNGPSSILRAVIEEAHARGLKVSAHLCSVTFTEAAAMGIDALQHGFITNSDYVAGKEPDVCPAGNMRVQADVDVASPAVSESIRRIVAGRAAVVSTLGVYETFVPGRALDPRALEMLDPATRREVEATHEALPRSSFTVSERLLTKMMQWERAFVATGGLLGAGSDPWGTGFLPGFGNMRNYELLIAAGFAPEAAIQVLTLNGARILGEEARIGSVEAGKQADLVVVLGDPVATPSRIYDVTLVFRGGIGYDAVRLRESVKGKVGSF